MSLYTVTANTTENATYFLLFKRGHETGLNYIYKHLYKSLYYYGKDIASDGFLVDSCVQEAFLKAWNQRERMTSMLHIFRFLRLVVRWECYAYFRSSLSRYNKMVTFVEAIDNSSRNSYDIETEELDRGRSLKDTEQLKLIYDAIPCLPQTKQRVIRLYLEYGQNPKKIAARYHKSIQAINSEVAEIVELLKFILVDSKMEQVNTGKASKGNDFEKYMSERHAEIYKLRKVSKYSLDKISVELKLPLEEVMTFYSEAIAIVKKNKLYG